MRRVLKINTKGVIETKNQQLSEKEMLFCCYFAELSTIYDSALKAGFDENSAFDYSLRGCKYGFIKYKGYLGEDILDKVSYEDSLKEINRIDISFGNKGLETTLYCYFDRYCNLQINNL